jgi:uncharacterized protein YlxW (UPF0749 family)
MSISLLTIILVFSIPIIAIISQTILKLKGTETSEKGNKIGKKELATLLEALQNVNEDNKVLRKRIENLETIVASEDWADKIQIPENTSQKDLEKLAKLLKKKD